MPISVGQDYHEGGKLAACIELLNRKFDSCHIVLCDSLQRYTLQIKNPSLPQDKLYEMAMDNGDKWTNNNKGALEKFLIPYHVSRWNEWLKKPDYNHAKHKIDMLYETNPRFREAFNQIAETFYARSKQSESPILEKNLFLSLCIHYIKEECTVLLLWAETESNFIVYPNTIGDAIYVTHDNLIHPNFPDFLIPVSMHIKRKKGS